MTTDDLITSLSASPLPLSRKAAILRTAIATGVGISATIVILALIVGIRPDLDVAIAGQPFWMKMSYTASIALIAMAGALTLSRPEAAPPRWLWLIVAPIAVLSTVSIVEAAAMDPDTWMSLWLGVSWRQCPALIIMLAVPIAIAMILSLRLFAPTRLRLTGGIAGMAAGGMSATFYCFHCPEAGAAFVLTWYTLGIAAVAVAGAIMGPRLLRW